MGRLRGALFTQYRKAGVQIVGTVFNKWLGQRGDGGVAIIHCNCVFIMLRLRVDGLGEGILFAHSRLTSCEAPRAILRFHYPVKSGTASRYENTLAQSSDG